MDGDLAKKCNLETMKLGPTKNAGLNISKNAPILIAVSRALQKRVEGDEIQDEPQIYRGPVTVGERRVKILPPTIEFKALRSPNLRRAPVHPRDDLGHATLFLATQHICSDRSDHI
jgi:hypothetical protein